MNNMKFVSLFLFSTVIFAYVFVEGKPKPMSQASVKKIDQKLDKITEILEEEMNSPWSSTGTISNETSEVGRQERLQVKNTRCKHDKQYCSIFPWIVSGGCC